MWAIFYVELAHIPQARRRRTSVAGMEANNTWTGLNDDGDYQARAKVRARHVRLVFARPSAELRLIYTLLFLHA